MAIVATFPMAPAIPRRKSTTVHSPLHLHLNLKHQMYLDRRIRPNLNVRLVGRRLQALPRLAGWRFQALLPLVGQQVQVLPRLVW